MSGPGGALWQEALACVPGGGGGAAQAEALEGTSRAAWRVRTAAGSFVVRLHDGRVDLPGVDRTREARLHGVAAGAGLAPAIIAADPGARFLVTSFVEGGAWRARDMADPDHLRRLAGRLRSLHALAPPAVAPFDLGEVLEAHARHLAAAGEAPAGLAQFLERARAILQETAAEGRRPCIVHNDLTHANLVGPVPMLVDWEYAAVADPLCDLACLLAYHPEAQSHASLLLQEGGLEEVSVARLRQLAWVYALVSWLWYRRYELAGRMGAAERAAMQTLRARLG